MKKLFVGVSALALVLTLGACGKKNTKSTSTQSTPTSETTSQGGTTSTTSQGGGTTSTTSQGGGTDNKIYLDFGTIADWWNTKLAEDAQTLSAHFFGGTGTATTWPGNAMTKVSGNIWSVDMVPNTANVIFNVNGWGGDCQTEDLDIPTDGKNLFTINTNNTSGTKQNGTWSTYSAS